MLIAQSTRYDQHFNKKLPLMKPELSVVVPVYNEEAGLAKLFARLYPALDALGIHDFVISDLRLRNGRTPAR